MSIQSATPAAAITLDNDWIKWLQEGDSINSHDWIVYPLGPTLEGVSGAIVKISGMTAGIDYLVEETVTTSGGESGKRGFMIRCVPVI